VGEVVGLALVHRVSGYFGQDVRSTRMQVVLVHPILVDGTCVLRDLFLYPGHILHHVGIHAGQAGMGTHNAPGHDAANKPAILLPRIRAQQRTTRIALAFGLCLYTYAKFDD